MGTPPTRPRPLPSTTMPAYRTPFQGYSVRWSPFDPDRLAVATAQNFGIIGNGKLHVLQVCGAKKELSD